MASCEAKPKNVSSSESEARYNEGKNIRKLKNQLDRHFCSTGRQAGHYPFHQAQIHAQTNL